MKIIRYLLLIICILSAIFAAVLYINDQIIPGCAQAFYIGNIQKAQNTYYEAYRQSLLEDFNVYYNQNNDFKGILSFESKIINERVVQAQDNDKYLRKNFNLKKDIEGTVFMDADCTLDSKNITIYGHNVYYNSKAKFSPLHLLTKQQNYEKNKIFTFKLRDEVRTYQVFAVYYYDWKNDAGFFYNTPDFQTAEGFQRLITNSKKRAFYDTGVKIEDDDYILTMQTCVKYKSDLRLIVVAKEINRK